MCETIPDLDFEHIKHIPNYECLIVSVTVLKIFLNTDLQLEHLKMKKCSLDEEILALSDICKK